MQIAQTSLNEIEQERGIGNERGHSSVGGMVLKMFCSLAASLAMLAGMPFSSRADLPLVYDVENTGTNFPAPPLPTLGNLPLVQPLPDPFLWADWSGRSTNFSDWSHHRAEIKAQIENYEIGTKPAVNPTNIFASYSGGVLTVRVTNVVSGTNRTLTLTCAVSLPAGSGPFPAVIGMNSPNGSIPATLFTSRNIARITFSHNQVTTYGSQQNSDPYYQLYGPALNSTSTGQYSAWAWGVSRIIDGLQMVTNTLPIDLKHICVTGCSYAGKMALFSGAFDERVALTIAQESGGGGATSWRYSHTQPSGSVELIDNTDHNWFEESMFNFSGGNVSYLPEDHHELMAMCAPRALLVTANPDYVWLSNPSCYVCSRATQQAYNTLGIPDRFGFSIVGGHAHCALPASQNSEVGGFLDKFLLGMTNANTSIATYPSDYNTIDYTRWYKWWGTGNPTFPVTPGVYLTIPAEATEGDGTLVGQGSFDVIPPPSSDLQINLTSSNPSEVTVPASVLIPAGQSNAVFDLTILDDSAMDGDQVVTITPSNGRAATITVHDNETATLSVTLPASASESAGTLTNAGSVSFGSVATKNVTVSLTSGDPSKLLVPVTAVIPAGQTSGTFNLIFLDNPAIEGPQTVSVSAHVPNWTDGSNSMTILESGAMPDHFTLGTIPSPQTAGTPFQVTMTAQDAANNTLIYRLPVTLDALAPGAAPGTNSLLNSPVPEDTFTVDVQLVLGYSFTPTTNLVVTDFRHYFGNKVTLWTDGGLLLASANYSDAPGTWTETPLSSPVVLAAGSTYRLGVVVSNVPAYFSWDLPATFLDGTINACYSGIGDVFPNNPDDPQWYFVDLRYAADVIPLSVNPVQTSNFTDGTWAGGVAVLQPGSNVILRARAGTGPGHSGQSLPFNVVSTTKLDIAVSGNSVVLSWPTNASGFHLDQATTLPNWSASPATPVVVGDRYNVTNTLVAGQMYFRLRKP